MPLRRDSFGNRIDMSRGSAPMNKVLVTLVAGAFAVASAAALGDDKTLAQPVDQHEQYPGNDPYGTTPVRTPTGTPLIGDFDRMTPDEEPVARKAVPAEKQQDAMPPGPAQPLQREPRRGNS